MSTKLLDISDLDFPPELYKFSLYEDTPYYEIIVSLFEKCNMNCEFCFEEKNDKTIDVNKIETEIPKKIFEAYIQESKKYSNITSISVKVMGGELFADNIADELFISYRKFYKNLSNLILNEYPNVKISFVWVSNGIFTKIDRVDSLLLDTNAKISFSYDPVGRFPSAEYEDMMINNYHHFNKSKQIYCVSIVLTKDSIYKYINNESKLKVFSDNIVDACYYIANKNWKKDMPSTNDIWLFFKWCLDNSFTNINPISKIIDVVNNKKPNPTCCCKSNVHYTKNKCTKDCIYRFSTLDKHDFYGEFEKYVNEQNCKDIQANLGLIKSGCLYCEYYDMCPKWCWSSLLFKEFKVDVCPFKLAIDYYKNIKDGKRKL